MIIRNIITRTHITRPNNALNVVRAKHHLLNFAQPLDVLVKPNYPTAYHNNRCKCPSFELYQRRYESSKTSVVADSKEKDNTENVVAPDVPLTSVQKLKKAVKDYGATVIVFHVGISLISLGSAYLLVSFGLDTTQVFMTLGVDKWLKESDVVTSASTFALAYALHKVFAPVRISITLASVPFIVRYLRNRGILKK